MITNGGRVRVLIVEDEAAHEEAIRRAFQAAGIDALIEAAGTLEECRSKASGLEPDIALMDLNLPDGSALEVLTSPPEDGPFPVLIMTSYGSEHTAVEALRAGALDYIVKSPESFAAIPRAVNRALREWKLLMERKTAEEALKESEERYRRISESVSDYIFTVRVENGRPAETIHSPSCEGVTGYTALEFASDPSLWVSMVHPDDRQEVKLFVYTIIGGFPGRGIEHRIIRKDGAIRWVLNTPVPRYDGKNRLIAYDGVIKDITERHRAEEEKRRLEEQLVQSQKMEAVGQLAGGVAHDFNNLLTPILGYSEVLLEDMHPGDPRHTYLSEIQKAADSAKNLTRQLLAFSRRQVLEIKPMDLGRVLSGFEKILRRTVRENITIKVRKASPLGQVNADAGQIEQIIMNLVVNAQDAMPDGGVLTIETREVSFDDAYAKTHPQARAGAFVLLEVGDTGTGMDKTVAERIFEPFYTTKEAGKGTGLGLSTVYGIVIQHGGFIDVESEPGRGTSFRIFFPRAEQSAGAEEDLSAQRRRKTGTETVLVTEDNESVRRLACEILRSHGYTVISAQNGREGLKILSDREVNVDLLLTDVIMPDLNGRDLYTRAEQLRPRLKVIYMSGYTDDVIAHHGILDPGVDLINKPFSMQTLTDKVRDVLDR